MTRVRWKLITVQLGGNDLCSYECGAEEGDARPAAYKVRNTITVPSVSTIGLRSTEYSNIYIRPGKNYK